MSATPVMPEAQERVVIAVDPHTASWTALAITADLSAVGALRVPANQDGYRRLRRSAACWPQGSWAIENAAAPSAPLTERLRADGIEVPAKLARRIHLLSAGHGRKTTRPTRCQSPPR